LFAPAELRLIGEHRHRHPGGFEGSQSLNMRADFRLPPG
jgi:hypothetical protein